MSTILTAAGESLIARLQAEGKALVIDTMILANVNGQDHTQAIAPGVTVPEEAQIALRYAIPPQYRAYVNPNQVVYSAMLGSDMGDFTFNWQGLWCSEHETLVAVATFPALEKRRYDEANGKTGNNLTRNFLLTFTGARELTGLTISADVWQLDFTVRLNGMDERERLSNFDIYGHAFFDAQGWLLQKTAEAYAFAPGLGYVGGIRAELAEALPLAAPESANLPQNVWLDVCLRHTGSDRIAEASPMLTAPDAPLADSAADETGLMHYRTLLARIEEDGSVTDLRATRQAKNLDINGVLGALMMAISDPWALQPPRVPLPVQGVSFGGSDGRRAIMPGETEARENWVRCDGGSDGNGGNVPDLCRRMILGASEDLPADSKGGSETHGHSLDCTVGATSLTEEQLPSHRHYTPLKGGDGGGSGVLAFDSTSSPWGDGNYYSSFTGGSQAHTHSLTATTGKASNLSPYYTLAYIMRVA